MRTLKNEHDGLVAVFFFLVYLFSALCVTHTGMQAEEDSLSWCCQLTTEAREISKGGKPHVHCPCDKCSGKATWRLTAWRYLNSECELSSRPSTVKKNHVKHWRNWSS